MHHLTKFFSVFLPKKEIQIQCVSRMGFGVWSVVVVEFGGVGCVTCSLVVVECGGGGMRWCGMRWCGV